MSWNKLNPKLQQQVIDKLVSLSYEQKSKKVSNAYLLATNELELWLNNREFTAKAENLEDDAVSAQDPLIDDDDLRVRRAEQKTFLFAVVGTSTTLGALAGAQLSSFIDSGWVFPTSLFGAVLLGTVAFLISIKND